MEHKKLKNLEIINNANQFFNEVTYPIRKFGRFIKRIFIFIPVIWKDEDWDYESIYDYLAVKLKRLAKDQENDTIHMGNKRRAKQIRICLAYLDRFRNWVNYYEYPMDDIYSEKLENGCYKLCHSNSANEAKRKGAIAYEKFNYDMFWKRFLQWHQSWWS